MMSSKAAPSSRSSSKYSLTFRLLCTLLLAVGVTQVQRMFRFSVSEKPQNQQEVSGQQQNQQQQIQSVQSTVSKLFPATCTHHQLETIGYQLPAGECQAKFTHPWANKCSFSYATRCPGSYWLNDYYTALHAQQQKQQQKSRQLAPLRTALSVGCNKGMDAVNTLRMLSGDLTIDKDTWRGTFFVGNNSNSGTKQQFQAGHCQQEFDDQFNVPVTTAPMKAAVYCIEAMPVTAAKLTETAKQLQWNNRFHVIHAAVGAVDKESVLFPDLDKVGVEGQGLSDCGGKRAKNCKPVQQFTLDSLVETFVVKNNNTHDNDNDIIDMISVDVEGFDWPVLLAGAIALRRTRYVELEYNWKGAWAQHKLSEIIETMKERGFACYWAGEGGHLWRITDCWLPHYDLKFWSNVACVNVLLPDTVTPSLAERMEATFLDTVAAGNTLQYTRPMEIKNYTGWRL
jgi:FkbM family methyltransferase